MRSVKGTVPRGFLYAFLHQLAPSGHLIQWLQAFPKYLKVLRAVHILKLVPVESHNADLKCFVDRMVSTYFLKGIGYINNKTCPQFRFTVPLKVERGSEKCYTVLLYGNSNGLLPTTPNVFPGFCTQCRKMFHVAAYNGHQFSAL
jgi:hypothetical protein